MKNLIVLPVLLGILSFATTASATPVAIAPGATVTTFTPSTALFSGTLVGTYTMGFANAYENGSVLEYVYSDSGTLNFYYQVTNSASSTDSLERITVGNYSGFTTGVDYVLNGGDAPTSATRQASGTSLGFNLTVAPGTSSDFLEVLTNATAYGPGTIGLIDTLAINLGGLAPAVPEPSTLAFLLAGLGIVAFYLRRRSSV